jgi:hypothetical protein
MIYIKLAGKESVRIPGLLYASWRSGVVHSYLADIGGFTFQCYR